MTALLLNEKYLPTQFILIICLKKIKLKQTFKIATQMLRATRRLIMVINVVDSKI